MLHPDTDLRLISPSIGRGVVVTRFIPKGTVVWVRCALDRRFAPAEVAALPAASRAQVELYAYVDEIGDSILCWDGGRYINHSCDPAMVGAGPDLEIAARDLAPGEDLTCEYGYLNLIRPLACQCGAANCRGTISRDDALSIHTENRICSPSAALHNARNGVSHSVAPCALQLGHSCGFQSTKWVARKDS